MSMMNAKQADQVRERLRAGLTNDVTIRLFVNTPGEVAVGSGTRETGETTRQLLEEVAALDSRIHLRVHATANDPTAAQALGIDHLPAVLIGRNGESTCAGVPSGFGFAAFLDD
jgi:hypothetical protein